MNRRGFLSTLGAAVAGFTVLPPATTYSRIWKARKLAPFNHQLIGYTQCFYQRYIKELERQLNLYCIGRGITPPAPFSREFINDMFYGHQIYADAYGAPLEVDVP